MQLIASKTKERLSLDDFKMKENVQADSNNLDAQGGNVWRLVYSGAKLVAGAAILYFDDEGDDDCH